jgi:hypothetical protein
LLQNIPIRSHGTFFNMIQNTIAEVSTSKNKSMILSGLIFLSCFLPFMAAPNIAYAMIGQRVEAPLSVELVVLKIADRQRDNSLSINEIPVVETAKLTSIVAKRALDAYVLVQDKYRDSPLEKYDSLQDFVDKDGKGQSFDDDVKSFGFKDVTDWNLAITTLSFAYTNALDDQTADIKQQIEEVTANTEMANDMKDRMIRSLKAMIPSLNNKKIVSDLMMDAAYREKIQMLGSSAK